METGNSVWITWENQRRNRELSSALRVKLFELSEIDCINNILLKYLLGLIKTIYILLKEKPKVVFCQNPSIVLSLLLVSIRYFTNLIVCVDAHNAGIFPHEGQVRLLMMLSRFIQKRADLTIVTNDALKKIVDKNGGNGFVLQDKIPDLPSTSKQHLKGKANILFICSYAVDEPFELLFQTARKISPDVCIYVSGNYKKIKNITKMGIPQNVILTGFMTESQYVQMLISVDAIIDLTTRENCLVCGAYEAVAAEKPLILSKTKALKEYFHMGTIFIDHTEEDIERAINDVLQNNLYLTKQIIVLKKLIIAEWRQKKYLFEKKISFLKMVKN